MDTLTSSWIVASAVLTVLAIVVVVFLRRWNASPRRRMRTPRETATVALVRRRRELTSQLQELAGDSSMALLQAEARRRGSSTGSIDVLEAAIARAVKESALAPLQKNGNAR